MRIKTLLKIGLTMISAMLVFSLAACGGSSKSDKTLTIGSKNFTENIILAHIMADLIEAKTDIKVERKVNLGGSDVAFKALKGNDIQLYPDYTGTIVANYYQEATGTADETLDKTRELTEQDNYKFLEPFGFNNTYTLAVSQETREKYNLKTFSDLAKVSSELLLGCEFEFIDRPDAYPGLQQTYSMDFKDVKGMDHGIMYRALKDGEVDVIDSYSTDGQLKALNLSILEDDLSFFPPYHAGPLVRQDTLQRFPELEGVLNQLSGKIDEEIMQDLNARVDMEGLKAQTVAHDFLVESGIIDS